MSHALPATPTRAVWFLATAAFTSSVMARVADPLLPRIAEEFDVPVSSASIISTAFTLAYGMFQLFYGPIGDRYGKYALVMVALVLAGAGAVASAYTHTLLELGALRFATGAAAAAIIPLSMAYIGDSVPYESRQPVLARFLSGVVLGVVFGQAAGGAISEWIGWRALFLCIGGLNLTVAGLLASDLKAARAAVRAAARGPSFTLSMRLLLTTPWVRVMVATVFLEGGLFFGGFGYVGAHLRRDYGLGYVAVGGIVAAFGVGGFVYSVNSRWLIKWLGERGLVGSGASIMAVGFAVLALGLGWRVDVGAVGLCGLGFYLMHNTLQTNATQMVPAARGLAVSVFASAFFLGQSAGMATCGHVFETLGYPMTYAGLAGLLLALGLIFRHLLSWRERWRIAVAG